MGSSTWRNPLESGEVGRLDDELYRLARGAGRLRLRIGQALHRLGDGYRELGFSTLGAYALERCCRGGRWAAESRALARRLQALPRLRAALESASVGWSMAELLARHATPQTEAALLELARDKTVQAMRLTLSPHDEPDHDEMSRTLSLTVPVEEAWALEATKIFPPPKTMTRLSRYPGVPATTHPTKLSRYPGVPAAR
jgi:hypothetical protein